MGILQADDKPWRSLTQSEASEVVGVINEAIKKRDGRVLIDRFDEARYVDIGARGFDVPAKVLEDLRAASTRLRNLSITFELLLEGVGEYGVCELVRTIPATDAIPHHVLYRRLNINGEPTFVTWWIMHDPDDKLRIVDYSDSRDGISSAQNLYPFLVAVQAEKQATSGKMDEHAIECLNNFRQARRLITTNQYKKSLELLDSIAKPHCDQPAIQMLRVDALKKIDRGQAIEALKALSSVESLRIPAAHQRLIIALQGQNQEPPDFAQALEAVQLLEKETGDSHLAVLSSGLLLKLGQMDGAKKEMVRAVANFPNSLQVRMSSISLCLQDNGFEQVINDLNRFDKDFPNWIDRYFQYTDGFDAFRAAPAGQAWLEGRASVRRGVVSP